jgi:hypothetical protein
MSAVIPGARPKSRRTLDGGSRDGAGDRKIMSRREQQKLYDRTGDEIGLDEVERIRI